MSGSLKCPSPLPLVSVVVTTYQHHAWIEECLEGILMQQTSFPVEILVGEDESTDGTREICQRYAAEHPDRIRLFLGNRKDVIHVLGRPTARANLLHLFSVAQGKYIALCEGDDYWTDPLKLQKQVDFLEHNPEYALCAHRAMLLKDGALTPHQIPPGIDLDDIRFEDLLGIMNFIATASVVYRNDKTPLPDYFKKLPYLDVALYGHLSRKGRIKCLDEFMSVYRITAKGAWSKLSKERQRESQLLFHSLLQPHLPPAQRAVSARKRMELLDQMARTRFPSGSLMKRLYRQYLQHVKYR